MRFLFISFFLIIGTHLINAQSIDVEHQVITVKPDWENESLSGATQLTIILLETTDEISLEGRFLTIRSVKTDRILKFDYNAKSNKDNLKIHLGRVYEKGEELILNIEYKTNWVNETDPNNIWGSLGQGIRFFKPSSTEPERQRQIWSVGEPEGNALWFPSHHESTDYRTTDLFFTVEKPLKVISNGKLNTIINKENGTHTFHWKAETAYAPHLTSFVVGRFLPVTQSYDGIDITSYCYPHEADATAATVERLPDMMAFFSNVTGVKYPYDSYSQVFVQEFAGWQANMMSSTITENMVDDWVTHKDFRWLWDIVESEALASQWFGVHIVPSGWKDVWLTKAFAKHLAGLYNEYKNGRPEYLSYQINPQLSTYFKDWNTGIIQPIVNDNYENVTSFVRSNHPNMHGASILHMLRSELGDNIWMKVLKSFTQKYSGKSVTTKDFQKVVNEQSNRNMDWFFDQWIYGVGHPVLKLGKTWESKTNQLRLVVTQVQRLDSLNGEFKTSRYFCGKMKIETDQKVEEIFLVPKAVNTIAFHLDSAPRFVNLDFENSWVKEVQQEQSIEELIALITSSKDVLAKISAINRLSTISKKKSTTATERNKINTSLRNLIESKQTYWRIKMIALWQLQALMIEDGELMLDEATEKILLNVILEEESWVKSSAIWFLGMTKDGKYADMYIDLLEDWSDRVTNAAAIALGKTKSPKAYDVLMNLQHKPSWKNQSLISVLNGLQWLEDPRGVDLAFTSLSNNKAKHWTLATPVWDHRLAASLTLKALGAKEKGFEAIQPQLQRALDEGELNDVIYNLQQLVSLSDPRAKECFETLKQNYAGNTAVLTVIRNFERQFLASLGSEN